MVLTDAIQDFSAYSRHELGHTRRTHLSYMCRLRHFARWLEEHGHADPSIHDITPELIRRYDYALCGRKLRPRTVRAALGALRSFFAYLVELGGLSANPALEVRLPKTDAAQRLLVTDEDLRRLLEAAGPPWRKRRHRRRRSLSFGGRVEGEHPMTAHAHSADRAGARADLTPLAVRPRRRTAGTAAPAACRAWALAAL